MTALSLMLFLYAGSVAGHGGVFAAKRFGNRILYLCGIGALTVIAMLVCTSFGRSVFGYGIPSMPKLVVTLVLTAAYFTVSQIVRYFISPKGKKAKIKEEAEAEPDNGEEEAEANEPSEGYGSGLPNDLFEEDENNENKKENNYNERSNDNDKDNG